VSGGQLNTASSKYTTIGGGGENQADGVNATVAGGVGNSAPGLSSTVGGGGGFDSSTNTSLGNTARGGASTVGGGQLNTASNIFTTVGGGYANAANGFYATLGGGSQNSATLDYTTVSGGRLNVASGLYATVCGGLGNRASGTVATVAGGQSNFASGSRSWAGGYRAQAMHTGAWVWSDASANVNFPSTAAHQFNVRAAGGVRIFTNAAATVGVRLLPNDTGWDAVSAREAKEEFQEVDKQAVLTKVEQLPITTWQLKGEGKKVRHLGPVAQDFHAAFQVGSDNQHINSVDADGVALVAIQALAERNAALEKRNAVLEQQIGELQTQLKAFLKRVEQLEKP
jgi:hypothetical protein